MNQALKQINKDQEPKVSINKLKKQRLKWKHEPRNDYRRIMLQYYNDVIKHKQWLYFSILQRVQGWKWGITLKT